MTRTRGRGRRAVALAMGAAVVVGTLAACGANADEGKPTLTWYINPDPEAPDDYEGPVWGQPGIAERCSTDEYTIETEQLPTSASEQRIQLMRRLSAEDDSIDLMSMDTVFTAEFAEAGRLAPISQADQQTLSEGKLQGAVDGATWKDELVVAPLWANTQLLWYRKSVVDEAGLDVSQPVTWDQIIDAAEQTGTTVGVQANKYEGYVVWLNALIQGAGGAIVEDLEAGTDMDVTIDSEAGEKAAAIVEKLASSSAAQSDLSVSNEGTAQGGFFADNGGFLVNWTYIFAAAGADEALAKDLGYTTFPATVEGEPAKPPIGGINIGIGAYSQHPDLAAEAMKCITSVENQVTFAAQTGQMPASEEAYDAKELTDIYPKDLLAEFRTSIENAGPRPVTPLWSKVVNGMLSVWHPPDQVDSDTPSESADFLRDILEDKALV